MSDNKARARITVRLFGEPAKQRIRRRKDVSEQVIDAWYTDRIEALRREGKALDRDAIIKECIETLKCTLALARAGWARQFPTKEGERHHGGRGKRLR